VKYGHEDMRNVLERASARETAARVAVGAVARQLLHAVGAEIVSHVVRIGSAALPDPLAITFEQARAIAGDAPLHCADAGVEQQMIAEIDKARAAGDTMGGTFEVIVHGLPPGLGSYVHWDRKLDGRLAQALMSIQAIKAVGIGRGPAVAEVPGSRVHDEILPGPDASGEASIPLARPTNNAGGLEGGVTNGQDLRVTAYMKPISTLMKPLRSVDLTTMTVSPRRRGRRRSDGRDRPRGRRAREVRRRFDRGDRRELEGLPRPHRRTLHHLITTINAELAELAE
jgi:chorismate synthase